MEFYSTSSIPLWVPLILLRFRSNYSKTRVAVPRRHVLKWLFPQEKATFSTLTKGTFTLVLL
jgi:hypothetical protein